MTISMANYDVNQALFLLWVLAESPTAEAEPSKVEQVLTYMNSNSYIGWGIAGFVLVAMATAAIANWTGNLGKIIEFIKKYLWPSQPAITDELCQAQLKQLNKVVLKEVTDRRNQSLHYKIQMDIDRELQMQRVGRPDVPMSSSSPESSPSRLIHRDFNPFESGNAPEPVRDDLPTLSLFQHPDIQGRLLILGEPGSGKTTELLSLAQDLLKQAQQSDDHPIPVIFELSAWSTEPGKTLDDWLIAQLKDRYNVRPEIAKHWLEHHQLLPLLDGLDELRRIDGTDGDTPEERDKQRQYQQIQCLHDINTCLELHPKTSLVVCCRRQEYEALEQQGEALRQLNGAIYLKFLDDPQIEAYFQKAKRPHLWIALADQPELLEMARSPLFLLMLLTVYQGQTITTKSALLDAYINKQLENPNNQRAYPPGKAPSSEQTDHYLSWLAVKLKQQETTEFLIESLQPSWLDRKRARRLYRLVVGLFFGLVFVLSTTLVWELNPLPVNSVSSDSPNLPVIMRLSPSSTELDGESPPPEDPLVVRIVQTLGETLKRWFDNLIFFISKLLSPIAWDLFFGLSCGFISSLILGLEDVSLLKDESPQKMKDESRDVTTSALTLQQSVDSSEQLFLKSLILFLRKTFLQGLWYALIFGLSYRLFGRLNIPLSVGLGSGLIGFFRSQHKNISLSEKLVFSWKRALFRGLFMGLLTGVCYGVAVGFLLGVSTETSEGLISSLFIGLIAGLIVGLIVGLLGIAVSGFTVSDAAIRVARSPNQGIKQSLRSALVVGLRAGLIIGLIVGRFRGLVEGIPAGLFWFALIALPFGLETFLQHLSLRFALRFAGVAPWNYARFLEHAENHRFIQRVGGRYRFVHDLLRTRFAERYQSLER